MIQPPQISILLIAPHRSYRLAPFINAARKLGLHVLIASEGEYSLVQEIATGIHIEFADPEAAKQRLLDVHRQTPYQAVLGIDDFSVALASDVASQLGLKHNAAEASRLTQRKDLARQCLQQAGVVVPWHTKIDVTDNLTEQFSEAVFPLVLKPLGLSASRGVIRVNDLQEAVAACQRIAAITQDSDMPDEIKTKLQAERFISGDEVAYEGLLHDGVLQQLAIFDKPDPLEGPFFEETYYIAPSRLPETLQKRIHATVMQACAAYGLTNGPIHAELRIDAQGKVWVIEVAARTIGGECARMLELATQQTLESVVLHQALGQSVEVNHIQGGAGVLMIPIPREGVLRRIEGVLAARAVPYIDEVVFSIREGEKLVPLPEGGSYLGFIYATAPSPEQAEQALREAHACLNIVTAPFIPLLAG
jgi:biotin carboxylase